MKKLNKLQKDLITRDLNLDDPLVKEIYENALEVKALNGLKAALKYIDDMCELHSFRLLHTM